MATIYPGSAELCMGDLVNLRIARKATKRRQAEEQAASNRLIHCRSKAKRALELSRRNKAQRSLDENRLEPGDG
jgi:Domain of unknown function (DUF4169)